jgi:hypothetical protein
MIRDRDYWFNVSWEEREVVVSPIVDGVSAWRYGISVEEIFTDSASVSY